MVIKMEQFDVKMEIQHFDIRMQVLFCSKHKKFFEEKDLKEKYGRFLYLKLVDLWREAELCVECEWKTIFGKDQKKIIKQKVKKLFVE